jgi:hypothetical protein
LKWRGKLAPCGRTLADHDTCVLDRFGNSHMSSTHRYQLTVASCIAAQAIAVQTLLR